MVLASKTSSHNTTNSNMLNKKLQNIGTENDVLINKVDLRNKSQQPIGCLRRKEEQIT